MSMPAIWFSSTENWLDERGKMAWLTAMIFGFIIFWPIGLAILFYMIWSKRMSRSFFYNRNRSLEFRRSGSAASSGNLAFDAYRDDTLKRLENEQTEFKTFLQRLRDAKDKTEFDHFMDERASHIEPESKSA